VSERFPDLSMTNFPNSIDNYIVFEDESADNKQYIDQINTFVANGDFVSAKQILTDHPELKRVIITAATLQVFMDREIAIERVFNGSIFDEIAGIVKWAGIYNSSKQYQMFNIVQGYDYKAYMCINPNTPIGTSLSDNTYFQLISIIGPAGTGLTPYTKWDNTVTYNDNAVVPYGNKLYLSIKVNNVNHVPDSSPDYWSVILVSPRQVVISTNEPTGQDTNDLWFESTDNGIQMHVKNSTGIYENLFPVSTADKIKTSDGSTVQQNLDDIVQSKDQPNGFAGVGADGKISKSIMPTTGGYVRQSSAPTDTSLLWVDSSDGNIMKFYNGSSWTPVPATWG